MEQYLTTFHDMMVLSCIHVPYIQFVYININVYNVYIDVNVY
jgi:hypothetical protein